MVNLNPLKQLPNGLPKCHPMPFHLCYPVTTPHPTGILLPMTPPLPLISASPLKTPHLGDLCFLGVLGDSFSSSGMMLIHSDSVVKPLCFDLGKLDICGKPRVDGGSICPVL